MIKVTDESGGNVLVLEAEGKLTDEDYKSVLIPRLESIIRERGKARFLFDLGVNFRGMEAKAMWDDARFGLTHWGDFEKIGIVADRRWVKWTVRAAGWLMPGEVRIFAPSQRAEAASWIKS